MEDKSIDSAAYFRELKALLKAAPIGHKLYEAIVNAPFHDQMAALDLDLGIIVLLLVNSETKTIDRIALSDTYSAQGAVRMSIKPFNKIKIPLGDKSNLIARAIDSGQPQQTADWKYLFAPALSSRDARFNQAGSGIEASSIYPLAIKDGGALIFSSYQPLSNQSDAHKTFMQNYAKLASQQLAK